MEYTTFPVPRAPSTVAWEPLPLCRPQRLQFRWYLGPSYDSRHQLMYGLFSTEAKTSFIYPHYFVCPYWTVRVGFGAPFSLSSPIFLLNRILKSAVFLLGVTDSWLCILIFKWEKNISVMLLSTWTIQTEPKWWKIQIGSKMMKVLFLRKHVMITPWTCYCWCSSDYQHLMHFCL